MAPKGQSTRPTADRTRQALFNVLEHAAWAPDLQGARVLDLFAGSGALGLESVSRGAAHCLLIDQDPDAAAVIGENIATLRLAASCVVRKADATRLGPRPDTESPYDFAFLDPPYGKALCEPALAALAAGGWLSPDALVAAERGRDDADLLVPGFERVDQRTWGAARVWFLRPSSP